MYDIDETVIKEKGRSAVSSHLHKCTQKKIIKTVALVI
jgi:hypothetical protein